MAWTDDPTRRMVAVAALARMTRRRRGLRLHSDRNASGTTAEPGLYLAGSSDDQAVSLWLGESVAGLDAEAMTLAGAADLDRVLAGFLPAAAEPGLRRALEEVLDLSAVVGRLGGGHLRMVVERCRRRCGLPWARMPTSSDRASAPAGPRPPRRTMPSCCGWAICRGPGRGTCSSPWAGRQLRRWPRPASRCCRPGARCIRTGTRRRCRRRRSSPPSGSCRPRRRKARSARSSGSASGPSSPPAASCRPDRSDHCGLQPIALVAGLDPIPVQLVGLRPVSSHRGSSLGP